MKSLRRISALASCAVLICGAAITWHFVKVRVSNQKLAENVKAYRTRAEQGDAQAQSDLASMYYYGRGVSQDYTQAAVWYRRAADQGYANAQYGLAFMYQEGKGVPQDYTQALDWCRKAANEGNARAQYAIGYTYYEGKEVPQDYTAAVGWYRKSANQGNAEAQSDLGYMYSQGKGVPRDYTQAVGWYRKAADHGYAKAQAAVGYAYSEGKGVPRDYAQSARWYRKAAKQGDLYAQSALGAMNVRFSTGSKINLSAAFLGCMLLLIGSRGNIRNRQQRRVFLAGLLGVLWVGLTVYGYSHLGILQSLSAVGAFYFGKSLLTGIDVVMFLSIVRPQGFKVVLGICGVLFIGFNVYAILHFDLKHFAACPRAFYSINALLIGMVFSMALFLWLEDKKRKIAAPT